MKITDLPAYTTALQFALTSVEYVFLKRKRKFKNTLWPVFLWPTITL